MRFVPFFLACTLLACQPSTRPNQLTSEAKKTIQKADELASSQSCENRRQATQLLMELDNVLETAVDEDPIQNLALGRLQDQASDNYHAYIRQAYDQHCCWAIAVIIECADEHPNELTTRNLNVLTQIKGFYANNCSGGQRTAML